MFSKRLDLIMKLFAGTGITAAFAMATLTRESGTAAVQVMASAQLR
jgi:hypothetical protein